MRVVELKEFAREDFVIIDAYFIPWYWSSGASDDYRAQGRKQNHLCYMVDGSRSYALKDMTVEQPPGTMVYTASGSRYLTTPQVPVDKERIYGYNTGFDLADANGAELVLDPPVQLLYDPDGSVLDIFKCLDRINAEPEVRTIAIRAEIMRLLDKLCSPQTSSAKLNAKYEPLTPAIGVMKTQMGEKLTVSYLSSICNMSENTFRRLFKQYAHGRSPIQYLSFLRMQKAEQVYRRYNASLDVIAQSVGFYDAAHMCHAYKKMFGRTFGDTKGNITICKTNTEAADDDD
jgi:AraC-like DNA-binding protein